MSAEASSQSEKVFLDVESESESDLELDTECCVEPDAINENQKMGDADKDMTEENFEKSDEKCNEALSQLSGKNFDKAIELFTEAIELNPSSALLFVKRGQAYLEKTKPNACIKDCTEALKLNPNLAEALKFRGRAYSLIKEWETAAKDLYHARDINFDEQTHEWLQAVLLNVKKIEQYKLRQERKRIEKVERERLERAQEAREANASASSDTDTRPNADDFYSLFDDAEVVAAFADPVVSAAFADIFSKPANFYKYQSNPKLKAQLIKLSEKLAKTGNFPILSSGSGDMREGGEASTPNDDNLS